MTEFIQKVAYTSYKCAFEEMKKAFDKELDLTTEEFNFLIVYLQTAADITRLIKMGCSDDKLDAYLGALAVSEKELHEIKYVDMPKDSEIEKAVAKEVSKSNEIVKAIEREHAKDRGFAVGMMFAAVMREIFPSK